MEDEDVRAVRERRANTRRFKSEMAHRGGGLFDLETVQALLQLESVEAVENAVQLRELLAVEDCGKLWFPRCQFDGGRVHPGIQQILKAIPKTSGWRILQYLFSRSDGLAGDRPIDLVQGAVGDIDRAVRFARVLES